MNRFKSYKKFIILSLVMIIGITSSVSARQIGEFSNFRITYSGQKTGYIKNYNGDDNYVLNLNPSRNLGSIKVKHVLVNSNDSPRSSYSLLRCGHRGTYSNWATAGYICAIKMHRENFWDGALAITGSWSPDER